MQRFKIIIGILTLVLLPSFILGVFTTKKYFPSVIVVEPTVNQDSLDRMGHCSKTPLLTKGAYKVTFTSHEYEGALEKGDTIVVNKLSFYEGCGYFSYYYDAILSAAYGACYTTSFVTTTTLRGCTPPCIRLSKIQIDTINWKNRFNRGKSKMYNN